MRCPNSDSKSEGVEVRVSESGTRVEGQKRG